MYDRVSESVVKACVLSALPVKAQKYERKKP